MPYDFDQSLGKEKVLKKILSKSRCGSIIVLHDKLGSSSLAILEDVISGLHKMGFTFTLPENME